MFFDFSNMTEKEVKEQIAFEQKELVDVQKRINDFKITDNSDNSEEFEQLEHLQDMKDVLDERLTQLTKQLREITLEKIRKIQAEGRSTFNQEISFDVNKPIKKERSIHKKEKLKRQSYIYKSYIHNNIQLNFDL